MSEVEESMEEANLRAVAAAEARKQAKKDAEHFRIHIAGTLVIDDKNPDAHVLVTLVTEVLDEKPVGNKRSRRRIDSPLVLRFHKKVASEGLREVVVPAGALLTKETNKRIFIEHGNQSLTMDCRPGGVLVFTRSTLGVEPRRAVCNHNLGAQKAINLVR